MKIWVDVDVCLKVICEMLICVVECIGVECIFVVNYLILLFKCDNICVL